MRYKSGLATQKTKRRPNVKSIFSRYEQLQKILNETQKEVDSYVKNEGVSKNNIEKFNEGIVETVKLIDYIGYNYNIYKLFNILDVKMIDLAAYEDGALIQDAFPYLTASQRELMLTGLTDDMWDEMFGKEEE